MMVDTVVPVSPSSVFLDINAAKVGISVKASSADRFKRAMLVSLLLLLLAGAIVLGFAMNHPLLSDSSETVAGNIHGLLVTSSNGTVKPLTKLVDTWKVRGRQTFDHFSHPRTGLSSTKPTTAAFRGIKASLPHHNLSCIMSTDNRQSAQYLTVPYSWTVYIKTSLPGGGTGVGSGFVVRQMSPPGYVVIVTAAHVLWVKNGPTAYSLVSSLTLMVTGQQYITPSIVSGSGCWFYPSYAYKQNPDATQGDDWGIILCQTSRFASQAFPAYGVGFGLLMDGTAGPQLSGIPGTSAGYPDDKPLPPNSNDVWYTTGTLSLNSYGLIDLNGMSTFEGQSGSPVWTTVLNNYNGQYMAVGVESYGQGSGSGCANYATYLSPSVGIEMSWLVWTSIAAYSSFTRLRNYGSTNVVLAAQSNAAPQVFYTTYVATNPPSTQQWLVAKLSMPCTGYSSPQAEYVLVSNYQLANQATFNVNSLGSAVNPGSGVQQCVAHGSYDNGCGSLTLTAPNPTSLVWLTTSSYGGGFEFGFQNPQVWVRVGSFNPLPNLQVGQGPDESFILDNGVNLY